MSNSPRNQENDARVPEMATAAVLTGTNPHPFVPFPRSSARAGPGAVTVQTPADFSYLAMLRAVAETILLTADFDIGMVADIRVALDEVATELIDSAVPGAAIGCEFRYDADGILIGVGSVADTDNPLDERGFGWTVLGAVTDSLETVRSGFDSGLEGYPVVVRFRRQRSDLGGG